MNKPNDTSSPIRLRAMEPEDLDLLYHIENDRSVWGVSSTNVPYSRYAPHDYVAHAQNDIYTDKRAPHHNEGDGRDHRFARFDEL